MGFPRTRGYELCGEQFAALLRHFGMKRSGMKVFGLLVVAVGLMVPVCASNAHADETLSVRAQKNVVDIQGFAAQLANADESNQATIFSGSYAGLIEKTNALYDELLGSASTDATLVSEIEQSLDALAQLEARYQSSSI